MVIITLFAMTVPMQVLSENPDSLAADSYLIRNVSEKSGVEVLSSSGAGIGSLGCVVGGAYNNDTKH